MGEYVPDMVERFPDMGEPEEEQEFVVSAWVPMMVAVEVYGTSKEEAIEEAKKKLSEGGIREKIIDHDLSKFELADIE